MQPSPVGIQHDLSVHSRATRCGALLVADRWVVLGSIGPDLLSVCWRDERQSGQGSEGEHHCRITCWKGVEVDVDAQENPETAMAF